MTKKFKPHNFDLAQCRKQLHGFAELLESPHDLRENDDILPFFKKNKQVSSLIGCYNTKISNFDLIAFEYDVFGDFRADLVIGDSKKRVFNFVEFEDASSKSVFVKTGKKSTREWARRFEHGYSQIIDWFYKINDRQKSADCLDRFDKESIEFSGTLIVGRDDHISRAERLRLEWRQQHVIVNSKQIMCVTFDELFDDLTNFLDRLTRAAHQV